MIVIKDKRARQKMKIGGQLLSKIVDDSLRTVYAGMSTAELDRLVEQKMLSAGLKPVCKGYGSYKHATCISVNDVVIHGVPSESSVLKDGDFVKLDVVGSYQGYCVDMARPWFVGAPSSAAKRLCDVAQTALDSAIEMIKPGIFLSDISHEIQTIVENAGFGVIRDFAGHGIGKALHEEPEIPNFGAPGKGPRLREGMTLAIEPMITEKDYQVFVESDGWTVKTKDGGLGAHVEDTILVEANGSSVLTRPLV